MTTNSNNWDKSIMFKKTSSRFAVLSFSLLAAIATLVSPVVHSQPTGSAATHRFGASEVIPDRYIVVFQDAVGDVKSEAEAMVRGNNGRLHHVYTNTLKGFAATLPAAAVLALRQHPNVNYVEQDQTITLNLTQNLPAWGLDRIDQVTRPLSGTYQYNYDAAGVNAFIIDTGIRADHSEFTGRLKPGANFAGDSAGVIDSSNTNDCNGHGTHVAGTVGGTTFGVAKGVSLIPVRVLDCAGSGAYSAVISGVDWVAGSTLRPAVANMSLGGGKSSALNTAVAGAVSKGVTMVVAAGNSNANACNYSPSSEPSAITVGATDSSDVRASYSNYGTCVDIFAPGTNITSAWNSSASATNTISGTSMASPHVTGVAALALASNPSATPAAVTAFLKNNASANLITSVGGGSPNLLVFSLATGVPTEPVKPTISVKSIVGSASKTSRNWTAYATVSVYDPTTALAMANVTVSGSFTPGGAKTCITGSNGSCKLTSNSIALTTGSSVFTISTLSGTNMTYQSASNAVTTITINKP
jgi:subtilisin family serine protease